LIVDSIVQNNTDPNVNLLYNPLQWRRANNSFFNEGEDWLEPPVKKFINLRKDAFSQR
jgi:hypothetical protein